MPSDDVPTVTVTEAQFPLWQRKHSKTKNIKGDVRNILQKFLYNKIGVHKSNDGCHRVQEKAMRNGYEYNKAAPADGLVLKENKVVKWKYSVLYR